MNWINIKDFKYNRRGNVIVKVETSNKNFICQEVLDFFVCKKSVWYDESIKNGNSSLVDVDDGYVQIWNFKHTKFKNVKELMFF